MKSLRQTVKTWLLLDIDLRKRESNYAREEAEVPTQGQSRSIKKLFRAIQVLKTILYFAQAHAPILNLSAIEQPLENLPTLECQEDIVSFLETYLLTLLCTAVSLEMHLTFCLPSQIGGTLTERFRASETVDRELDIALTWIYERARGER